MNPKEYFDTIYGKQHIQTIIELEDLDSLYDLIKEYADYKANIRGDTQ